MIYRGKRMPNTAGPGRVEACEELPPRNDIRDHSPDGFQWSYAGSGPAQLALAILAHHLRTHPHGDRLAEDLHQKFKRDVIARIHENEFVLTTEEIEEWLKTGKWNP